MPDPESTVALNIGSQRVAMAVFEPAKGGDAETLDGDRCKGWNGFSNEDLQKHCSALLEEEVLVVDDEPQGAAETH